MSSYWEIHPRDAKESDLIHAATNTFERSIDTPKSVWPGAFPVASYVAEYICIMLLAFYILLFAIILPRERKFRIDDPSISYPYEHEIAPLWACLIINIVFPFVLLVVYNLAFVRNYHDLHHMALGFILAALGSIFMTSGVWLLVGGHPPNFLAKQCQPDMEAVRILTNARMTSYNSIVYFLPSEVCTGLHMTPAGGGKYLQKGDILYNLRPAFPSGRASTAFAGWIFFALYIGNKHGCFNLRTGHIWKTYVLLFPTLFISMFVSMTGLWDYSHNFDQIFVGTFIGVLAALVSYKSKYVSLSSHIPSFYLWERIGHFVAKEVKPIEEPKKNDDMSLSMEDDDMSLEELHTDFLHEPLGYEPGISPPTNTPSELTVPKFMSLRNAHTKRISFSPSMEYISEGERDERSL